jgi:transcriptional regulator with XRE-family HTH domain
MSLREIRDEHALSLRELAARARLTKATIVNIEAGRVQPHPSTVRKLAAALDVAPGQLMRELRHQSTSAGK